MHKIIATLRNRHTNALCVSLPQLHEELYDAYQRCKTNIETKIDQINSKELISSRPTHTVKQLRELSDE